MFKTIKEVSLLEGITHIEDLGVSEFIAKIENLSNLIISEKLDGANLWTGFDVNGKFYTTRAGKKKNAKFFYSIDDYPNISAYSGFKAAHLALDKIKNKLKKSIKNGEAVEIEILFGRQPNAVTYGIDGKSYIAFIRPVQGDGESIVSEDSIEELSKDLEGDTITVMADILTSDDGEKLKSEKISIDWKIVKTQTLDSKELKHINLSKEIKEFKKYLSTSNDDAAAFGLNLTNAEVLGLSLTKVPKDKREELKAIRQAVADTVLNNFKLPIKEKLLNDFVRKIKPKLQGTDLDDSEDTGVEGVVARDPSTGEQFKIVDKDVFTTINSFNWGVRANVDGTVKTDDPLATKDMRGGAVGEARIRIANLLGMRELAKAMTAKRFLAKFGGKNEYDTAKAVADSVSNLNFRSVKTKIRAILSAAKDEVREMLSDYKKEVDNYKVELKNGKTVKYSPEIKRRTLTAFAEVKSDLESMITGVDKTSNLTGLILVLYGKTLKSLFDDADLNESILSESKVPSLDALHNLSHDQICDAYLSTLFASLLLLKLQDSKAKKLIHDTEHMRLRKYSPSMSPLNFWGMVLFNPDVKEIKNVLSPITFKQLWKTGHRFLSPRIKNIHSTISQNAPIDWDLQAENMRVVLLRLEARNQNTQIIKDGIISWDELNVGDKETVLAKVFYLIMQHAPTSPLIGRLREMANKILLTANKQSSDKENTMLDIRSINRLAEDGEVAGGESSGESSPSLPLMQNVTSSSSIASVEKRLFKNKVVIKRKRTYEKVQPFARPTSSSKEKTSND